MYVCIQILMVLPVYLEQYGGQPNSFLGGFQRVALDALPTDGRAVAARGVHSGVYILLARYLYALSSDAGHPDFIGQQQSQE